MTDKFIEGLRERKHPSIYKYLLCQGPGIGICVGYVYGHSQYDNNKNFEYVFDVEEDNNDYY